MIRMINISLFIAVLFSTFPLQARHEEAIEVKLPGRQWNEIIIEQNIDSVYSFLCDYVQQSKQKEVPGQMNVVIDNFQSFTIREIYEQFRKEGKEFYNVYTHEHSVPARWNIKLSGNGDKTIIGFQLAAFFIDSLDDGYPFAKEYFSRKEDIVSNGNLEGLVKLTAKTHFATQPVAAVGFSRENGYDNSRYKYDNFIPGKEPGTCKLIEKVPLQSTSIASGHSLLIYSKDKSRLLSVNMQNMSLNWKQEIPFAAGQQNQNSFTIRDQVVYLPVNNGTLSAIDVVSGKSYWQCSPAKYDASAVAFFGQQAPVSDNMVYVNDDEQIYAINRLDGQVAWSQHHGGYGHYNYSFDDRYLYKSGILELFRIDKQTGEVAKVINSVRSNTFYHPNLLLNGNLVLCDGNMALFDLEADTIIWKNSLSYDHILTSPDKKRIYIQGVNYGGDIQCLESASGKVLWKKRLSEQEDLHNDVLDFKLIKGTLCILALRKQYNPDRQSYKILLLNATDGSTRKELPLDSRPISNLGLYANQLYFLNPGGISIIDPASYKISDKKYDFSNLVPESDFQSNYIQVW